MAEVTTGAREEARPELRCVGCGKRPGEIGEFLDELFTDGQDPDDFVWENEGTLNEETGLFACTACYIALGQPSRPFPERWTAGMPL